ncbi:MAG: 16S rRNA (cytosine(1402)-N(4))-methyltransferase RsmH [Halanaerobiaceae bacterium]
MTQEHKPVLLKETIEYLNCKKNGVYLDGTVGRGGHTQAILENVGDKGLVIGIDRDYEAIKKVRNKFKKYNNCKFIQGNFINIEEILENINVKTIDGMLFDLGVSSPQLDNPERGFSYRKEGPLDMRMNQKQSLTAENIVNNYTRDELTKIIRKYGEERWASRIAEFIIKNRKRKKITTTTELVSIIKDAIPASARREGGHPARRTFQALRIATNDELNQLEKMLNNVINFLVPGGRICVISFHSLEDRIVKHTFRELNKDCVCPPDFPICVCDKKSEVKIITKKPVQSSKEEIKNNPRARSAKLRVAEKL